MAHDNFSEKVLNKNIHLYDRIVNGLTGVVDEVRINQCKSGNVNILVVHKNTMYSIIRFAGNKSFKIFYPYMSFNNNQVKVKKKEWSHVVSWFKTEVVYDSPQDYVFKIRNPNLNKL